MTVINTKRIAKNTLLLYFRMILTLCIGLYTSRVILNILGVEDYGIYSVVAGFLGMFRIMTGALSAAIMRFITIEIANKNIERLKKVFSTSFTVQFFNGVLVLLLIETVGIWFLNNKMTIPYNRLDAATFCLHCSAISVFLSLLYVPFNSLIIAYEKMSAFAYVSILETFLKLVICYMMYILPYDNLKTYALLLCCVSVIVQLIYWIYCKRKLVGCSIKISFNAYFFKKIWSFAGWNFLGNSAGILNSQGINMLMNIFFGVVINAARGIADQVSNIIQMFVNNFMTALNPQITKSYAIGDYETSYKLVCRGARFSFYIMFILALPIMLEADIILKIWLGQPPKMASTFLVWTILSCLTIVVGNTLVTLQLADGNIKIYQIVITSVGCLPFPLSWIAFKLGAPVVVAYFIYFFIYWILIFVRFFLVHKSTLLPIRMYMHDVVLNCHLTAFLSLLLPLLIKLLLPDSFLRLVITCIISILSVSLVVYFYSMSIGEKIFIKQYVQKIILKIKYHGA